MRTAFALILIALTAFCTLARAGDAWPQFRGPTMQGISESKGLPLSWSESEHVRWKTELPGEGWSSPVVADGEIWLTTAMDEGHSLHAVCVDLETGKIKRDVEVFHPDVVPAKHERNSFASPTPVIAGDRVFVHFGSMGTAAIDRKNGTKIWENRDLQVDFQNGAGGSPILYQNRLLISCDGMDYQYEAALDADTGKIAWKTDRSAIQKLQARPVDMRKAYSTPVIIPVDGKAETISTGAERLYSYDPSTGKELWYVDIPGFSNVPLPAWNSKLLVQPTGFMKPELWGIRLGGEGNVTATNLLWKVNSAVPAQSSPLLVNDRVYMVSDGGIASCVDANAGKVLWKQRIGSDFAASPVYVDGRIYFCDTKGVCTVVAPADTFQQLAANTLDDGFMASPAIVGKAFILRTKTHLYRIEN